MIQQRLHITLVASSLAELGAALGEAAQAVRSFGQAWRTMKRRARAAAIRAQNLNRKG